MFCGDCGKRFEGDLNRLPDHDCPGDWQGCYSTNNVVREVAVVPVPPDSFDW